MVSGVCHAAKSAALCDDRLRFPGTEKTFSQILEEALCAGYLSAKAMLADATCIKANANMKKATPAAKRHQAQMKGEDQSGSRGA